jgi:glycosyltransferase involved in cell wall biosynthesis
MTASLPRTGPLWSIVIAYYNEREFIAQTLQSAVSQRGTTFRLVLVDNRSDDDTAGLCRAFLADHPEIDVRHVHEDRPGHAYAVEAGFALVDTPFVAFWDADTVYPPGYLATAQRVLETGGAVLAQATDLYCPPHSLQGWLIRWRFRLTQIILSHQGHTGFFGICARTDALARCGGPMNAQWPWVLEDHELIHRLLRVGRGTGSIGLWCQPAPRRTDNAHVRWTLFERILYHAPPFALKDWFFYRFLAARFAARQMVQSNLRVRDW